MKRHLECAEQQVSPSNLTKYCACHEKWLDCFIVLTYVTSFPMRGATGVTIQPRQILRLPRKMTLQDFKENLQKQVKRHFQCGADPTMIRAWSENENANRNPPRKWGYFARSPEPWDSKKLHFLASCSRLSFLSQEATSRSLFFWLPATFFSFLAHFWCSRSLIFRLLGPRSSFLAQEAASWKLASWKPKKPILEAKKTSFLNSPRSYFLKSKKLVFLASRKHVKLKMFWFKV